MDEPLHFSAILQKNEIPKTRKQPLTRQTGTMGNLEKPAMNVDWSLIYSRWQE